MGAEGERRRGATIDCVCHCKEQDKILVANNIQVEGRAGTIADVPVLLALIRSMTAFEELTVSATEESLRAALFW